MFRCAFSLLLRCFPGLPKDLGFIIIADQSKEVETQPVHTLNRFQVFPPTEERTLIEFARYFKLKSAKSVDQYGRNVFHLLFEAVKYCWLACEIACSCFANNAPKLAGDYKRALSQRISTGPLAGKKPLHILCHNSDACLTQLEIIRTLVENNYVTITDFEELFESDDSWKVIMFFPHTGRKKVRLFVIQVFICKV